MADLGAFCHGSKLITVVKCNSKGMTEASRSAYARLTSLFLTRCNAAPGESIRGTPLAHFDRQSVIHKIDIVFQ
jgi:hypothetical protein